MIGKRWKGIASVLVALLLAVTVVLVTSSNGDGANRSGPGEASAGSGTRRCTVGEAIANPAKIVVSCAAARFSGLLRAVAFRKHGETCLEVESVREHDVHVA